jgi:hypothetical protein
MVDFIVKLIHNAAHCRKTGSYSVILNPTTPRGNTNVSCTWPEAIGGSAVWRQFKRLTVVMALLFSVLGVSVAPAMASTDTGLYATALPLQTVRQVNHGWLGRTGLLLQS